MIVLFNPLSTTPGKQPLPLSLLALAAVLNGRLPWRLVDGNVDSDPAASILALAANAGRHDLSLLAVTVMPGPQVTQAVAVCRAVRRIAPGLPIVWGGYFPTQHADVVLQSPLVDFVIRSQGEQPLLHLIETLQFGGSLEGVSSLSWTRDGRVVHNPTGAPRPLDEFPDLPYDQVPMEHYLHKNYLGRRTVAHYSSFGCPFACGFCAVVAMARRRWLHHSPARTARALRHLARTYGADAVQMHDMDFFISEERTAEIAHRITDLGLRWWALGRADILMRYSDATWRAMRQSGLTMVFSGAESGSDERLAAMNKGGSASTQVTLELARRMREHGIVPEFSFVLGSPPDPLADLHTTFEFIRVLKRVNPATEVVLYTYTPVPADSALYADAAKTPFAFPTTLEAWASPHWQQLSMRRGDGLPWIDRTLRRRVRNFERVLNAFYPTVTDPKLTGPYRVLLRSLSTWRYRLRWYGAPYELRALHRLIHYQRPETTGF